MFGMNGLCINISYCYQEIPVYFFLDVLFRFNLNFFVCLQNVRILYIYGEYSCWDKLIHDESATMHLLFAEYVKIEFHLDALDVSFSVFVWKCI